MISSSTSGFGRPTWLAAAEGGFQVEVFIALDNVEWRESCLTCADLVFGLGKKSTVAMVEHPVAEYRGQFLLDRGMLGGIGQVDQFVWVNL